MQVRCRNWGAIKVTWRLLEYKLELEWLPAYDSSMRLRRCQGE